MTGAPPARTARSGRAPRAASRADSAVSHVDRTMSHVDSGVSRVDSGAVGESGRPAALEWSVDNCPIGLAMAILGEKWTLVVLREIFSGIRRFDEMRERTHIPRQVLTNRLGMLVEEGILRRMPYREPGARVRQEYRLTPKGFDLYPVLVAVRDWGDRYLVGPEGPPLVLTHRDCGMEVHVGLHCADGHQVESPRHVVPRPGPGARRRPA